MKIVKAKWFIIYVSVFLVMIITFLWLQTLTENNQPASENTKGTMLGDFRNPQMEKGITDYLLTQGQFSWKTKGGSQNFCTIDNLQPEKELFPLYVWAFCSEYSLQNGELEELSGSSGPVKIDFPNELSYYDLTKFSHEAPSDGAGYSQDVKRIFPLDIQSKILKYDAQEIKRQNEIKAREVL